MYANECMNDILHLPISTLLNSFSIIHECKPIHEERFLIGYLKLKSAAFIIFYFERDSQGDVKCGTSLTQSLAYVLLLTTPNLLK